MNNAVQEQCERIGARYVRLCNWAGIQHANTVESVAIAISALTTQDGIRLDLERLEEAPSEDFAHDVAGILRRVNPITGLLPGNWRPRCVQ